MLPILGVILRWTRVILRWTIARPKWISRPGIVLAMAILQPISVTNLPILAESFDQQNQRMDKRRATVRRTAVKNVWPVRKLLGKELGPIEDNYLRTPQTIYISTSPPCSCPKRMLMKSNSGHIPIIYLVLKLLNGYIMCLSCVTLLEENRSRKRKLEILCRFCYQLQWTATKKGTKIDGMFCPNDG